LLLTCGTKERVHVARRSVVIVHYEYRLDVPGLRIGLRLITFFRCVPADFVSVQLVAGLSPVARSECFPTASAHFLLSAELRLASIGTEMQQRMR
jgi:hypothetical protein